MDRQTWIKLSFSKQHDGSPVVNWILVAQVHENLSEKTGVDFIFTIEIALSFDEDDRAIGRFGLQNAIGAEASLLDLMTAEGVGRPWGFSPSSSKSSLGFSENNR